MKILYVEDNAFDADLAQRELARYAPEHDISIVSSMRDARANLAQNASYDLVLLDLHLPDGGGLDLLTEIRQQALPVAVVVLTGSGDEEAAVNALKAGADDYLVKREDYLIRLPLALETALNHFRAEAARQSHPLRVLYAEHNIADIDLTRRHLARHAPHIQLDVVTTVGEVLQRLSPTASPACPYDVLMLDYRLPGPNALELLKILRHERDLDLPIILVTGQGTEDVALQAWRLGATEYLVKNAGYLYKLPIIVENAFHRVQLEREQHALRESEARYRRLAENAQDLIYRYRLVPPRGFEYVNPAATAITGYTPEEHYADPDLGFKLVHPDDRHLLAQVSEGEGINRPVVLRWVRKDNSVLWTEQRNVPIYDDQGQLIAIEGIARDITIQKHIEDQLRASEESFRVLFESNPHPMWVYDRETLRFLQVNDAAMEHYGYSREEFLSMNILDIRPAEEAARLLADTRRERPALQHSGEWRHCLKNGQIIDVEITSHTLDFAGRDAVLVVAQDITARRAAEQALKASEEKYRQIVETAQEGIWIIDAEDKTVFANQRMAEMLGYTVDEMLGQLLYHFMDDEARALARANVSEHKKGRHEFVYQRKDGTPLWTFISTNPLFDPTGRYVGAQAMVTDISDLKQTQQAELEQRALAQGLASTANALISALDLETVMNTILDGVARVVPHDASNIMLIEGDEARPFYWRGYPPELNDLLRNFRVSVSNTPNLRAMFETGLPFLVPDIDRYEDWITGPLTEWVKSYLAVPIRSHNNVIGFLNLDSDTPGFYSEHHAQRLQAFADQASIAIEHAQLYEEIRRHTTELELRVEERTAQLNHTLQHIEAILNNSDDVIILCQIDGRISQVNPAFDRVFGQESDEVIFQPLTRFIDSEHIPAFTQAFEKTVSDLQPQRLEISVHGERNTAFDADVVLSPVVKQTGQISGVVCSLRDITERKQMEDQLRNMLEHEIGLSELKSRFVSMAAHDLRNPLAVIQSAISIIHQYRDRLTPDKLQEKFTHIQSSIQVMVNMLDDILTLGRVESGKLRFEPAPLNVLTFCEDMTNEVKQATGAMNSVNFSIEGDCSSAVLDARLLRHILGNLLSNALKYSPTDTPVTLSAHRESDRIVFRVQDQGIGIPEDDQKRLFETFYRANNVRQIPGTGLGLAIVKQSVELHGGTIAFESREGVGTTFIVTLPQPGVDE